MAFLPSLSTKELHRYHRVVTGSVDVRSHFEVLAWLQGDMLRYLPHQSNVRSSGTGGGVENDAAETRVGTAIAVSAELLADYDLTKREAEVLRWVARGKTNAEIAQILHVSAVTVKNHMRRLFQKLKVSNRAQAVSKLVPSTSNVQN